MLALIDGDIIKYEIGFAAEAYWRHIFEENNEEVDPETVPWDVVEDMIFNRIGNIMAMAEADDCILYFTGSRNFRFDEAKLFKYKQRSGRKPFHFNNIEAYLKSEYKWKQEDGYEADDLMAIALSEDPDNRIICSRDKDLYQVSGWHYSWAMGYQPERPKEFVTQLGYLELSKNKIRGGGFLFFCAQLLMGDSTDTIPGIHGYGPVKVFNTLKNCASKEEAFMKVMEIYERTYGNSWRDWMLQVGRCLWLCRKEGQKWEFNLYG